MTKRKEEGADMRLDKFSLLFFAIFLGFMGFFFDEARPACLTILALSCAVRP